MNQPRRPIVRYHGGKWLIAPWIIDHFPPHRKYVEPYGGGASVLLRKSRVYSEVYNDLDGEIVNLFRVARDYGEDLRRVLYLTPFSKDEFLSSYQPVDDPIEQARRTVARSFMGFGSNSHNRKTGFRSNSDRSGTTPALDWRNYPDALVMIIERLRGVVIENGDALDIIKQHDKPGTLHYVDPPYLASVRDRGIDYRHEMTEEQHIELSKLLKGLDGNVVLSGYPSELYNDLYGAWTRFDRTALADGARKRTECIWVKNYQEGLFA